MKTFLNGLIALVLMSSSAFAAAEYRCFGKENGPKPETIDTILVIDDTSVRFEDSGGTEQTLERARLKNEEKNTFATYADYGYDGYGGFIELRVPKKIRGGEFPAYFAQDVYSELGRVAQIRIKLACSAK